MYLNLMKGKIHRATVTEANLEYVGSITIDQDLMDRAGFYPNEKVQIVDNNNGSRLETYIIPGERGSGVMCLNGAAARMVQPGDKIIVIGYCWLPESEAMTHTPKIVFVDDQNKPVEVADKEIHGTKR